MSAAVIRRGMCVTNSASLAAEVRIADDSSDVVSTPDDAYSARIFERMKREGARIEPEFDPLRDE
jgi:hypothetical protein